jgi:hypothetical protein
MGSARTGRPPRRGADAASCATVPTFSPQPPANPCPLTGKKIKFGQAKRVRPVGQTQWKLWIVLVSACRLSTARGGQQNNPQLERNRSHGRLHSGFLIALSCLARKGGAVCAPPAPQQPYRGTLSARRDEAALRADFLSLGSAKEVRGGALPPLRSNAHPLTKNACMSYLYRVLYLHRYDI